MKQGNHFKLLSIILVGLCISSCGASKGKDKTFYTVTFNSNGGSYIENQTIEEGHTIITPNNPTREGHEFSKWTYQGENWNFTNNIVTKNMTLDANWIKLFTITWKNYDGQILKIDTDVRMGTTPLYKGETPTRTKDDMYTYSFNGWSPAVEIANSDAVYTAKFTSIPNL